jgi:hypothetical protein
MPSRLADISATPLITEYAQNAAQEAINPVAAFVAPSVEVMTATGKYKIYTSENRFRIPETRRALHGKATVIGWDADDATYNCEPHALDCPVDEAEEDEGIQSALMQSADEVAEIAGLAHEKKVITSAVNALTPVDANFGASVDVIDFLDGVVLDVLKKAKYGSAMRVGILCAADVFRGVKNHPKVLSRFVTGGGNSPKPLAVVSESVITDLVIGRPDVRTSFMVYDTSKEGAEEDIQFLLQGKILVFARHENPTRRDPSFMKTFRLRGKWMVPGTYTREDGRGEVAKMDWSEQVAVTNAPAAVLLNVNFGSAN